MHMHNVIMYSHACVYYNKRVYALFTFQVRKLAYPQSFSLAVYQWNISVKRIRSKMYSHCTISYCILIVLLVTCIYMSLVSKLTMINDFDMLQ